MLLRIFTARAASWLLAAFALSCTLAACDDYPKDPANTLERVRGGTMRVGLLMDPPWVDLSGPVPSGVEVALAAGLAARLGAEVDWVPAGQADVMQALRERELDLVVGGLTESNPWRAHVAFTRPYYDEEIVVATGTDLSLPALDGVPVAVEPGTTEPALVGDRGGVPVPEPAPATELRAMARWQLAPGQAPALTLHTDRHVFAVPKGENAWLIAVDRFLREHAGAVEEALREYAR